MAGRTAARAYYYTRSSAAHDLRHTRNEAQRRGPKKNAVKRAAPKRVAPKHVAPKRAALKRTSRKLMVRPKHIRVKKTVQNATVYMDVGKNKAGFSAFTIASIALIFVCSMSIAAVCAAGFNGKVALEGLRTDLKELQEANLITETEIAKSYDIKEIERVATTKLGMTKPKPHQIVHVNVPTQSYAVGFDGGTVARNESESFFGKFFGKLKNLLFG